MFYRPRFRFVAALALTLGLALAIRVAHAQTGPTRATPCSATTAWNAVCVSLTPPTTYTDGLAIPATKTITYRVEDRLGTGGTYTTVPHTGNAPNLLVSNLAPGLHFLRVYATVDAGESTASNVASQGVTTGVPNAPVITIAVNIATGARPVVMELTARHDGSYRCRVVSAPKGFRVSDTCKVS